MTMPLANTISVYIGKCTFADVALRYLFKGKKMSDGKRIFPYADPSRIGDHKDWSDKLFSDTSQRMFAMITGHPLEQSLVTLHPSLGLVKDFLRIWRRKIADAYTRAEKDIPTITHEVADGLHDKMMNHLFFIASQLESSQEDQSNGVTRPNTDKSDNPSRKRTRERSSDNNYVSPYAGFPRPRKKKCSVNRKI